MMLATDFEYDGQCLSDWGFIICDFNTQSGASTVSAGSNITFEKTARFGGRIYSLTNSKYDECVTATFDICKDSDIYYRPGEMVITNDEYRDIIRWLNRREFLQFRAIHDSPDDNKDTCYYNASFNIEKITIAEKLYGLRLTMETDKPFGYGAERQFTVKFDGSGTAKSLTDASDEIGLTNVKAVITCRQDGDIVLRNETIDNTSVIKNCKAGEVITLDGAAQIILSSYNSHDVVNDFNFEFFKIGNTINNRKNLITASIPCDIVFSYFPIIKDIP